jgi:hypothetical protein
MSRKQTAVYRIAFKMCICMCIGLYTWCVFSCSCRLFCNKTSLRFRSQFVFQTSSPLARPSSTDSVPSVLVHLLSHFRLSITSFPISYRPSCLELTRELSNLNSHSDDRGMRYWSRSRPLRPSASLLLWITSKILLYVYPNKCIELRGKMSTLIQRSMLLLDPPPPHTSHKFWPLSLTLMTSLVRAYHAFTSIYTYLRLSRVFTSQWRCRPTLERWKQHRNQNRNRLAARKLGKENTLP